MRRLPVFVLVPALASLTACGGDEPADAPGPVAVDERVAAVEPARSASETDGSEEAPREADTPSDAPERPTLDADDRRALREAIRAGRAATRRGDSDAARAHFDRALELNPASPRTRCEAGYAALSSDEGTARRYAAVQLGLGVSGLERQARSARRDAALAMCLYNRGLLAERADQRAAAVGYFERSLALRPNAAVRRRLDAARGAPPSSSDPLRAPSLEALAEALAAGEDGSDGDTRSEVRRHADPALPTWESVHVIERFEADGERPEVGVLEALTWASGPSPGHLVVAVRRNGGWSLALRGMDVIAGHRLDRIFPQVHEASMAAPGWLRLDLGDEWFSHYEESYGPEDHDGGDDVYCYTTSMDRGESREALLCELGDALECHALALGSHGDRTEEIDCEGAPVPPGLAVVEPGAESPSNQLALDVDPERGVRLRDATPDDGRAPDRPPLPLGEWVAFDALDEHAVPRLR